jgi:ribulose-5-phosphate 4-epimerase/fuculose-1-phosphate aldolase
MAEQEGVIKYQLHHQRQAISMSLPLAEFNAWRQVMIRLQLIGQTPARYQGYGFGNISVRTGQSQHFIISGTQTGHLPGLNREHLALIERAEPEQNRLYSIGLCKPSSEALTHAMLYQQDPGIQAVIHVHSPDIWRQTRVLKIPHTRKNVPYGTPAMAEAVKQLFMHHRLGRHGLISMLGHEDGIIAFGESLAITANCLIKTLADAFAIEFSGQNQ